MEWKKINGYENYSVSKDGNIRNDKTGNILKSWHDKKGYLHIDLCENGKHKNFLIHRLVAEAFILNPENKPYVDHINTVRDDNRAENLRWVTQKENCNNELSKENYSKSQKGRKLSDKRKISENHPKSKKVICITTGEIFKSAREAERQTGANHSNIIQCCQGKRKTSGKHPETGEKLMWKFLNR